MDDYVATHKGSVVSRGFEGWKNGASDPQPFYERCLACELWFQRFFQMADSLGTSVCC